MSLSEKMSTFAVLKNAIARSPKTHLLTDDELHMVQRELLLIMDDIHEACEKLGLEYVVGCGAALGAVRHQGFIPWDDDIDIMLCRKDYDKLRDYFASEMSDRYFVEEVRIDPKCLRNIMKIRKKGTVYEEFIESDPDNVGLFIDVYSLENVSDSKLGSKWQGLWTDGLQFICSCVRFYEIKDQIFEIVTDPKERKVFNKKIRIGRLFSFRSLYKWLLTTERVVSKNKNDQTRRLSMPMAADHFWGAMYERDWIFPAKPMQFEDRTYYFPNQVDLYLKSHYGNYMEIPPVEKRERHAAKRIELLEMDFRR